MSGTPNQGMQAPGRSQDKTGRMPSLDGLRALSILMVIIGHLNGTHGFGSFESAIGDYAHLGVVVFFVISGFLITSLLIGEHKKNGRVSLKLFYARRSLRIFPVAYSYLAVLALLWLAGFSQLYARDFWHAITYTVNYQPHVSWDTGHLWSLSVEEQFYLLWPLAFILLGVRKAAPAAALVIVLGPIARVFNRLILIGTPYHNLAMFPMVADSLAVGCVLALARGWLESRGWYIRLFHWSVSIGLLATIFLINRYMDYTIVSVFGTTIINILIAILIHRSVYNSDDAVGRFLNWRPFAFIGVLSYSLYVWQQLFLNRHSDAWVNAFPQNVLLAFGATLLSYVALEKPLLRLRHKLKAQPALALQESAPSSMRNAGGS